MKTLCNDNNNNNNNNNNGEKVHLLDPKQLVEYINCFNEVENKRRIKKKNEK